MRRVLEWALRLGWRRDGGKVGRVLRSAALPAEWAYRGAVALRNLRYDRWGGVRVDGLRVVSVGNLAVGGTGKTPVAAWAARALAASGRRPALLSRGYGDDELLLHRLWNPEVPVHAGRDRVAAARAARDGGADAVVLDDGFQHRRLARDVDVVLLAAEDPLPGLLLPRGPFREPASALARAHALVVTRRTATEAEAAELARAAGAFAPGAMVARLALVPAAWRRLDGAAAPAPRGGMLAVTAVARPDAFASQLRTLAGEAPELAAFPDHHEFTLREVKALRRRAGERTVVVTEKDAVKLRAHEATLGTEVRVLTQALRWEAGEAEVTRLVTDARGP